MYQIPFEIPPYTFEGAVERLHTSKKFGIQPMLETVEDMLAELGNPDDHFESVQIAGTNGKTSTSRYTAAILMGEGKRVALYTSPELVCLTERMELMGRPVSKERFARGLAAAVTAGERVNERRSAAGQRPYDVTEFDLLTVAALVVFAEEGVDVAVLECGMGGRWDATSAAHNIKSVAVTGIGLDHMRILGDTLEQIAGEKAAIIKPGRTCVLGAGTATPPSVEDVLLGRCIEVGVEPTLVRPRLASDAPGELERGEMRSHPELAQATYHVTRHPERIGGGLALDVTTPRATYEGLCAARPAYQAANIACAVALAEAFLGRPLDQYRLSDRVGECPTPGRFNVVSGSPLHLVDAAHNPQSIRAFLASLAEVAPDAGSRPMLLCAVLADKDVHGIVGLLADQFPRIAVCATSSDRALPACELADEFASCGHVPEEVFETAAEALDALAGDRYVAVGSITLAGEAVDWHRGRAGD